MLFVKSRTSSAVFFSLLLQTLFECLPFRETVQARIFFMRLPPSAKYHTGWLQHGATYNIFILGLFV